MLLNAGLAATIRRTVIGLILIGLAGGIGYWVAPSLESTDQRPPERQTLAARSVAHTDKIHAAGEASVPDDTDEFIRENLDRRVTVPAIDQFSLTGVTIEEVVARARVPVLVYENQEEPIVVYAYNYALLDEHSGELYLSEDLLRQLEHEDRFTIEQYEDYHVVLWRHRDDIFAAVTRGNPDSLVQRIRPRG